MILVSEKYQKDKCFSRENNGMVFLRLFRALCFCVFVASCITTLRAQNVPMVTTLAGDGTKNIFYTPNSVAVDKNGNVYVASAGNHKIIKITPFGVCTTFAGSGSPGFADGAGVSAQFNAPTGLVFDALGNLYVSDKNNNRIRKITPDGVVVTFAGSTQGFLDGVAATAQFNGPYNITIDGSGNLYTTDINNHCVRKITQAGVVSTVAGNGVPGSVNGSNAMAQFNLPFGIVVDNAGNLYVSDTWNHRIRKITPAGVVTVVAGGEGGFSDGTGSAAKFSAPGGLAIDSANTIYIADINNHRIRKMTPDGSVTTIGGTGDAGFADNMPASQALFNHPFGVSCDIAGNVYVADTNNNRIRKIAQGVSA